ncbi:MAG: YbdD/YjiX family protein [Candidatus Nitrotoga sp.]
MSKGLAKKNAAVSDSSLPVFGANQDINQRIAQSATLKINATCVEPLPLWSYLWRVIRELSGDDAYERYIAQHATSHPDTAPLARKDFFIYQQQQKWSGIQRCC